MLFEGKTTKASDLGTFNVAQDGQTFTVAGPSKYLPALAGFYFDEGADSSGNYVALEIQKPADLKSDAKLAINLQGGGLGGSKYVTFESAGEGTDKTITLVKKLLPGADNKPMNFTISLHNAATIEAAPSPIATYTVDLSGITMESPIKVTFNANGGAYNRVGGGTQATQELSLGSTGRKLIADDYSVFETFATLPANKVFLGWATKADAKEAEDITQI